MSFDEEQLQDQSTAAIDQNQPNSRAKTRKKYKGIRTAREEIFESRYLSSWGGNASAPDGETEKGKSEGMVRGTQKATDMWGPPHVQLQNRQSITKQIQRIERIQREYRTLQKSSAGSRRNARATFSFPFFFIQMYI